jgi:RNase H-like domain found in reverse transcriptase
MCGYYQKFVPNHNAIAASLSDLTKKEKPETVLWTDDCERAFNQLKCAFTSKPILRLPDLNRPFTLKCDSSSIGRGAALLQSDPNDNDILHPVAHAGRKVNQSEANYSVSVSGLECLALIFGIEKFQTYIYGKKFFLQTDHKPLTFLASAKKTKLTLNALLSDTLSIHLSNSLCKSTVSLISSLDIVL